ncbi:Ankyrin repeat domain-containing protein 17 [Escovopsis weberi]|uniref:Ankyrin repeat domain-containing protein 17 n=1 Tax=Escovopsis weberi TaxID=150374 RepID=A0A0M8MRH3_ESCWE|nr:Ankyrin repeat domain-containing protein 17 [Escovopsis weberi]
MEMQIVDDYPKGWDSLPTELKLEIVKLLPLSDVSRLSRINKAAFDLLIDMIYQYDSVENDSSAIFRAAGLCSLTEDPDTMGRVLARSLHNGGDVRARHLVGAAWVTSLHVAAAFGSAPITSMLLAAGADTMWYPLLVPFVMGYHEVIHVLVQAGAPGRLAVECDDRGDNSDYIGVSDDDDDVDDDDDDGMLRGITVHHFLAAGEEVIERRDRDGNCLFAKFQDCIDVKLPATGYTALHFALDSPSTFAFDSLLQAGADIEATEDAGRTPLLQACIKFCRAQGNRDFVNRLRYFIDALLAHRANVNYLQGMAEPASPLMALVRYVPWDCDVPTRMWKEVDDAFMKFFTGHSNEVFDILAAEFPGRMPAERMVHHLGRA